jgi:hypothetical protein
VRRATLILLLVTPALAMGADGPEEAKPAKPEPAATAVSRAKEAIRTGLDFLLETQNPDGSWGYHAQRSPYMIYAPVPGAHRAFKVATSGLALMAVRQAEGRSEALAKARSKGLEYIVENGRVKRSHGSEMYAVWGWAYGLQAISRALLDRWPVPDEKAARTTAKEIVKALAVHQTVDGGWGYFDFRARTYNPSGDSASFVTSSMLIALHDAKKAGIKVPARMVEKALTSLARCRSPEGTYGYGFGHRMYPQGLINRPGGSLTRTPSCDLALFLNERVIDRAQLAKGVRTLLDQKKFARMALHRPIPHESWFSVSGYFYLFGYYNAAEACKVLEPATVAGFRDGLIEEVLLTRHPDGSFWDYPLYGYHKPYGTGYALGALLELTRERKKE